MNNLILSINVVLPLFLLMGLGYFLKFSKLLDEQWLKKANILVFKVFLPMLLFINIYQTDLHKVLNPRLMVFIFLVEIAIFLILLLLIPHLENNPLRKGVLIQGIYRSNYIIFGIPVTINLFGPSAAGSAAIITILVIPMFNIFAVLVLKMYSDSKTNAKNVLQEIISNPLIISSFLGIFFLLSGWQLPIFLENTMIDISKAATPLALMILGGSFQFSSVKNYRFQLFLAVLGRLLIIPLICLPISILLGFRNMELAVLLSLFGSPTAVSSFTMAQQMGADADLAGQIVVFTTLFSVFTIFIFIFIFKTLGYL